MEIQKISESGRYSLGNRVMIDVHDSLHLIRNNKTDKPLIKVAEIISKEIDSIKPQIVLCPFPDRHIDHRLVFESVMVATRPIGVGNKISARTANCSTYILYFTFFSFAFHNLLL